MKKNNNAIDVSIILSQDKIIQRQGESASQMIQAYKGIRVDSLGKDLNHKGRSLKRISNYKINDNYKATNIKQQSGFCAEHLVT